MRDRHRRAADVPWAGCPCHVTAIGLGWAQIGEGLMWERPWRRDGSGGSQRNRDTEVPPTLLPLTPHDVDGKNAALMAGKKVVDETSDDGVRFVSGPRHDPANQHSTGAMPFQIDCAMSFFAMNLGPSVGAARALMFRRDEAELFQARIGHDLLSQRSMPTGDDLNNGLHLWLLGSASPKYLQMDLLHRSSSSASA